MKQKQNSNTRTVPGIRKPTRRRGARRPLARLERSAVGGNSVTSSASWGRIESPDMPIGQMAVEAFPTEIQAMHERCHLFADTPGHWFVREAVRLNAAFANFGLHLKVKGGDKWLDGAPDAARPNRTRRQMLEKFISTAWRHRFTYTNAVAIWWRSKSAGVGEPFPQLVLPQECLFKDAWGNEVLTWQAVGDNAAGAPAIWKDRAGRNVILEDADDFGFGVFRRSAPGNGFGTPEMVGVFGALFESESLEASEGTLALAARQVIRQHVLGHEQKYGQLAGQVVGNSKVRREALQQALEERVGIVELAGNFDHEIRYVVPDPKHYAAGKWESVVARLLWWSGPLGHLPVLRGTSPYLMWTARVQHAADRIEFGAWLEEVIADCCNQDVKLAWSNRCYSDPRIAAEQARFAYTGGILSQGGYSEDAGFDDELELERRRRELGEVRDRLPLYDPSHGYVGGVKAGRVAGIPGDSSGGGRPAGVGNTGG